MNDHPALHFSGDQQFLNLEGQVLHDQSFSIFAVVTDENTGAHREIFSNWSGSEGNSTTSVFLGSTGSGTFRLSDDFAASPPYPEPHEHFLVAAINSEYDATIFLNATEQISKSSPLQSRNLSTQYVIGQQGNINGEFWKGNIAELIIYNRDLEQGELKQVEQYLMQRYQIIPPKEKLSPELLALASLCHVLFNSNEFMFVD
ncbi:MAG: LamG-like jellyroll fold domain-containing protein [Planctomycetaceae bacterium]